MAAIRPAVAFCILLLFAINARGEVDEDASAKDDRHERIRRDDVSVLSLEENERLREPPVGVLSSTARTFVRGGATTEYLTQILGTTVGRTYARLLSTGTRVFQGTDRPKLEPFLVFPSVPGLVAPTQTSQVLYQTAIHIPDPIADTTPSLNEVYEPPEIFHNRVTEETVETVRERATRLTEIKPVKVRSGSGLPTVTIKADFAPSGFSADTLDSSEKTEEKKSRGGKGLFRGGVQIKNELMKYDTVTYVGFADFTTTVGNTIIIFMPKTAALSNGAVTSIAGEATLRGEQLSPTSTNVLSPSKKNENLSTLQPSVQADIRASKAFNPVYSTEDVTLSSIIVSETETSVEPESVTPEEITLTESLEYESVMTNDIDPTETMEPDPIVTSDIEPTEALPTLSTLYKTTSMVYNSDPTPLGIVKSIGVTEEYDGTTILRTSFLFGTIINDAYTLLTQTATNVIHPTTTSTSSENLSTVSPSELITEDFELDVRHGKSEDVSADTEFETTDSEGAVDTTEEVQPTPTLVTQLIPTTIHKTFTYLTTFFIPGDDDSTSTSVRSREVISDEVQYVTTVVPEGSAITNRDTIIFPTGVTDSFQTGYLEFPFTTEKETSEPTTEKSEETALTQGTTNNEPVTTESSEQSTTEKITETDFDSLTETKDSSRQTTPLLPSTITDTPETTLDASTEESNDNSQPTTESNGPEVELIFKTLFTTYTYFTTFFQETTTSVKSREVVVTNVVTTSADISSKLSTKGFELGSSLEGEQKVLDVTPTVSKIEPTVLFNPGNGPSFENTEQDQTPKISADKIQSSQEEYKTYTYYTTVFVDGETIIESRTEVQAISPTEVDIFFKTDLVDENSVEPIYEDLLSLEDNKSKKRLSYGTISRARIGGEPLTPEALIRPSESEGFKYDTTMARDHRHATTQAFDEQSIPVSDIIARDAELKKEAMLALGVIPHEDSEAIETMVTDVTSSSSGGIIKRYDESYHDNIDQVSSETNTEEIEPRFSPSVVLQTSYTTFTYFTTVYKGSTSDIISRLETVSNVVTETVRPTEFDARLSPEEATLPVTYFTTFTYWTTLYKGSNTLITSREETISNVITPTVPSFLATEQATITESPVFRPSETYSEIVPTSVHDSLEPTTYYTTYTYFTTSYIENETIVNSHLETETNVVTPTPALPKAATDEVDQGLNGQESDGAPEATDSPSSTSSLKPTGILSTIRSSEVNDGLTTLFQTDVYGTYIDGLYAQILESSTQVLTPTLSSTAPPTQPTGIVSLNEGKIVDADGVSTIFYTTKAIGTYIDDLYAQVIESTSSIKIDEEKKTLLPTDNLPTTVIGSKIFRTGLVRIIEGSFIKDKTTTFYESKVIGTLIDGKYAQIIESTTSFKVEMASTPVASITPTSVSSSGSEIAPTESVTTPSPTVIESSLSDSEESSKEDRDENSVGRSKSRLSFTSKKNTFTPSIRPFASRPRPTFQPKKKTGDPATTITRTQFTPTVTATPASKSSDRGFGSSRNRFAANRKSSSSPPPVSEIKPTSSGGRRFSRPRTTASNSAPNYRTRSTSSKLQPTISSSFTGSRRGGFNYRTSASRPQIAPTNSRFRVRPTIGFGPGRFQPTSTTPLEDLTNNDISGTTERSEDSEHHTDPEEEQETPQTTTTESARRQNNPLLRFRRPPILQRASTTTTTKKPDTTTRKSNLLRRPDSRGSTFGGNSPRPKVTPAINTKARQRPGSNLFPPRGLFRKPSVDEVEEEEANENEEPVEEEIKDNEYEGSETSEIQSSTTTEPPKTFRGGRTFNPVQIRPFARRPGRNKRQAEYGTRSFTSRYRRPATRYQGYDYYDYEEQPKVQPTAEPVTQKPKYTPRHRVTQPPVQQNRHEQPVQPRIRPSPSSNSPRAQFTLRERTQTTTNPPRPAFKRPTTPAPRRRTSNENSLTPVQRSRATRPGTRTRSQTNYQQQQQEQTTFTRNNARTRYTTRRPVSRSRYRDNTDLDSYTFSQSTFDGTITVTHKVPTEVTIPIINGKNTEYKNVITAKPSLEVLGPHQYSTSLGKDGKQTILLTSEFTSSLANGAFEVTKYIVQETPTTSVTFTPTVLRGRKTSFSHVLPSTVYDVREEISTIQPKLNAPLANLLLSQLLAGNLGLPNQVNQVQPTPTTEFKTKTTTYVTTVTSYISTVLPLTFRGKEIKTTIVDSSSQVITATEYLTETIVVTPTPIPQLNNQLNTLLLPALLQAQLLGQNTAPNPLLSVLKNDNFGVDDFELQQRLLKDSELAGEHKLTRKRVNDDFDAASVVTLYVSGKHPGEFSTVLSTVTGDDSTVSVRKREVGYYNIPDLNKVETSKIPELGSSFSEDYNFRSYTSLNDVVIESSEIETQSLESIVGDVSRHVSHSGFIDSTILQNQITSTVSENDKSTGHFLSISPAESAPDQRIGTSRSDLKVLVKREIITPPHRRRVRIKVPRIKSETNYDVTTEAIPTENYDTTTHSHSKKIKVFRKKVNANKEQAVHESLFDQKEDEHGETTTPVSKRRKILVSRKRVKDHTEAHLDRPKITITRRRPVHLMTTPPLDINQDFPSTPETNSYHTAENTVESYDSYSSSFESKYENLATLIDSEEETTTSRTEYLSHSDTPSSVSEVESSADNSAVTIFYDQVSIPPSISSEVLPEPPSNYDYEEANTQAPTTSKDNVEHTTIIFFDDEEEILNEPEQKEPEESVSEEAPSQKAATEPSPPPSSEAPPSSSEAPPPQETSTQEMASEESLDEEEPTPEIIPTPIILVTRTLTTTRLRTFTYVVTRVSGTEQVVTSTTAIKPRIQTITVTESLPLTSPSGIEARYRLSTKVMSNGVHVIVAGDRTTLPGALRVLPSQPTWPITLPPTTLSDYMMMTTPALHHHQNDPNDFVTKTYLTTYTYLTTFSETGSTVISSRERVVSNVVTEEIKATKTLSKKSSVADHVTLSSSPKLTTGVYHTTYTYFNTMVDGELPLVVTSKKTVANTITEPPSLALQPTELPIHSTNTYLSTFAYTKTLSDGEYLKVVSTEDVLTRVIITESDNLPSTVYFPSALSSITPTPPFTRSPVTTDVTKTYFVTYTYFKTLLENGQTTVKSEIATSSDVFTEKYTINPKRTQVLSSTDVSMNLATDIESSSNVIATKTYLTTFTYFTTLLQDNSSPSIVVKSRTKVVENVVMETIDPVQINSEYQSLINKFGGDKPIEFNEVRPIQITSTQAYATRSTATPAVMSSFEDVISSNIVTGSTVISSEGSEESTSESSRTATPSLATVSKTRPSENYSSDKSSVTKIPPQITPTKRPANQMESFIKIGSLGLNALGPMINAMAGLIKNNLKANKRNDTVEKIATNPDPPQALVKRPPPSYYAQPPPNLINGLNEDPETAESQNFEGFNQFQDIQQRHKNPLNLRTNSGTQILGGGIPISPGQVITANSDVIIGKPAIHGPRPPPKKTFENENVEGMKPPPPPPPLPPPVSPTPSQHTPKWHLREQENHHIIPNNNFHLKNVGRLPPDREFGDLKLGDKLNINLNNSPKIHSNVKAHEFKNDHKPPPEFLRLPYTPAYPAAIGPHKPLMHTVDPLYHIQIPNHHESHQVPQVVKHGHIPFTTRPHYQHYGGFPQQKNLTHYNIHYHPPGKIPSDNSGDHAFITPPINHFIPNSTLGVTDKIRPTEYTETLAYDNELNQNLYNHKIKLPHHYNKHVFDGSSTPPRPLLVNIQPSQVANVIIPHGSSVALIYNNRTENHAPKGQIINEPSAYPDIKVGMVAGLTTSDKGLHHSAHMPVNAVKIDVPVSPQRTNPFTRPTSNIYYQGINNNNNNNNNYFNNIPSFDQYKPPRVTSFLEQNYYNNVDDDKFDDLDEESDQIETEGGEVIQASNERPLRPGQLPPELLIKPTTPSVFGGEYFGNLSRTTEVTVYPEATTMPVFIDDKMDLTYTKLKTTESNNQLLYTTHSPVISTKPLPSASPPPKHVKPTLPTVESLKINLIKPTVPIISQGGFTAMISDKIESKISEPPKPLPTVKTHDDTIATMNMDEKPPKPTFETAPTANFGKPIPGDLHMSSPRPFSTANKYSFERHPGYQNEAVLGLSPPPPPPPPPPPTNGKAGEDIVKRPFGPIRKRPLPPYKPDIVSPTYESTKISKVPEIEKPILVPVPTGVLSPPRPTSSDSYFEKKTTIYPTTPRISFTTLFSKPPITSTTPESISPVLGGSLTVEEIPQKSEVITSDSKISVNNVITGKPMGHFENKMSGSSYTVYNGNPVPDLAPTKVSKYPPKDTSVYNSVITGSETMFVEYESSQAFGKNSATDLVSSGATTIFYETKPPRSSTQRTYASTIFRHPSKPLTYITNSKLPIITSEVVTTTKTVQPTSVSKIIITHTKTLTVTTTESTVIKSQGMKPSTHTLVITKTLTSMILDTVTEVHTLIKPTSILSTVTTTIPQATTTHTIYPPQVATTTPVVPRTTNIPNHKPGPHQDTDDSDTILVVMTDKNSKNTLAQYSDEPPPEIEAEEEELEIGNNLLLAGLIPGSVESDCHPSCRASRNEVCQKIDNIMRCVCRPGFARMFADRPCKPTYTYKLQMPLEKFGRDRIKYAMMTENRLAHQKLWDATREGLDRMAMQSDLRDIFHGVVVTGFNQTEKLNKTTVNFYYQLSDNTEEDRIQDVIKKYLKLNNYNLGGTDVFASKESAQSLKVEDFDECSSIDHNDCSENAQCFNLKGTYTCSCNEGYVDISHNTLYPGRICSAEPIGCERCHFHGSCYTLETKEICECFQWYAGDYCQINLKVVLLVLVLAGASMIVLLVVCLVLSCMRQGPRVAVPLRPVFRPAVLPSDKRAMIAIDTSSEASDHHSPPPYIKQVNIKSSRKAYKAPSPPMSRGDSLERDRSLTVMIPRAKYRPAPPPLLTMSTFTPQQKLINYLNQPDKQASRGNSRKPSNSTNHSHDSILKKRTASPVRKPSTGALVSAGYEVSATVGRTKELDECFIPESHTDLGRPSFNSMRTVDSSIVLGIPPPPTFEAELIDSARTDLLTVSQARSYDETTIHPPTKSLYSSHYGKHTLCSVDEGHTMNERDVGSSYTMTQSHLYKSERGPGSDISNFDSL